MTTTKFLSLSPLRSSLTLAGIILSLCLQAQLNLGDDISTNAGIPVRLEATFTGTFATMVEAWDDAFEGPFPIGFPFTFYGENFDSISMSPNAVLSFDINPPTYYLQMLPIPNAIFTKSVMGPYQDLFSRPMSSPHNTYLYYGIIGESPHRKFVAGWCEAPMYACSDLSLSSQIVLEEGSNIVYNNIFHKPECDANQGNRATQGLNYDISKGVAVDGRNNESWTADLETWRFSPDNSGNYDVEQIDFEPVWVFPKASVSIRWYQESVDAANLISEDWSVEVAPQKTTKYFAVLSACGGVEHIAEINVHVIPTPTAFNPGSPIPENRTFGFYVANPGQTGTFRLQVFNRWGTRVFATDNPLERWDGTFQGKDCQSDVYTWVVQFSSGGEIRKGSGTITLIR